MLPFTVGHIDTLWPFLVLSRNIVERFLFLRLFPPCDRWCDVLGFVSAASDSRSSTLQIFRDANRSLVVCRAAPGGWTSKGHYLPFFWHEGSPRVTDYDPQYFAYVGVIRLRAPQWGTAD